MKNKIIDFAKDFLLGILCIAPYVGMIISWLMFGY